MDIHILKVDETEHWSEAIQNRVERIFGVYIYDPSYKVRACEITASYELHEIDSQFIPKNGASESEIETLDEIMIGATEYDVRYMHCHILDDAERIKEGFFPKGKIGIFVIGGLADNFVVDSDSDKSESEQLHDYLIEEAMAYVSSCGV